MTTKDPLAELIKRRHPRYGEKLAHWDFLEATYEGGRKWFDDNIFKYFKEGDGEFKERVKRAYRFNHTKQVVDLVDKYLFKMEIARKADDAPDSVRKFWEKATLSGLDIEDFSKQISTATSKFGRIHVVVDSNAVPGAVPRTKREEKEADTRTYAYIVTPQDMLDMAYDEDGALLWALIREMHRDDMDPLASSGEMKPRYRLWERDKWRLFEERAQPRGKPRVVMIDEGVNALGVVPIVSADHTYCDDLWAAPGLIDDVAYLDRANANYLSNLDAIIQDQTFSQLVIPAQAILPGEDGYEKAIEASTKRTFTYNGEGGKGPEFISPDPRQAPVILSTIGEIVSEIYHSVGLQADRTGSNSGGAQSGEASGVAKAYDFEKINSLLAAKAAALELTEDRINALVAKYAGDELPEDLVTYPVDFDVRGIYDEFEIAARLNLLSAPDEVRREQMRMVIKKLFPKAGAALLKKLEADLKKWPPEEEIEPGLGADKGAGAGKKADPVKAASTQKTAKELAA